jgi:hypothetical protein
MTRGIRSNAPGLTAAIAGESGGVPSSPLASTGLPTDYILPELVLLLARAKQELDRHPGDIGHRCTGRDEPWPCDRAHLAAATLGWL